MEQIMTANISGVLRQFAMEFQYTDLLDILIVIFLIYAILLLLKRTRSFFILGGMIVLLGIYLIARIFNLYLTSLIFQAFFAFFAVIFVVIFQRELRNFFEWLSSWGRASERRKKSISEVISNHIIQAVEYLARNKTGALIVLSADQPIERLLEGGVGLDGRVSTPLLLSIFDSSSPGHDGAVVIEGDRVRRFGVHLPLAEKFQQYGALGTRHRAALGLAERSDALIIVVSEERGTISLAFRGELKKLSGIDELRKLLADFFKTRFLYAEKKPWHYWVSHNFREKALAVVFALVLWFVFVVQLGAGVISKQFEIPIEFRFLPDNYIIENLDPKTVTLILNGRTQDFNLLDPDGLKVIINISKITEGKQSIKITENLISRPPALSIGGFSPKSIQFRLVKKEPLPETPLR